MILLIHIGQNFVGLGVFFRLKDSSISPMSRVVQEKIKQHISPQALYHSCVCMQGRLAYTRAHTRSLPSPSVSTSAFPHCAWWKQTEATEYPEWISKGSETGCLSEGRGRSLGLRLTLGNLCCTTQSNMTAVISLFDMELSFPLHLTSFLLVFISFITCQAFKLIILLWFKIHFPPALCY